jgi:hypothetical protein
MNSSVLVTSLARYSVKKTSGVMASEVFLLPQGNCIHEE